MDSRQKDSVLLPKRKIGKTDIETSILIVGGHSFSDLPRKSIPDLKLAVKILEYLYNHGLTHFDCTWKKERERFNILLEESGLRNKILPVLWHGWHDRVEETADQIVESFQIMLGQLGCQKAGMIIMNQWDHKEEHRIYYNQNDPNRFFADWFIEGFLKVKDKGLTDAIGWAVEPGPLADEFLFKIHQQIDFIAPFWNYRDRKNQFLVEFARENGLGVYSIAPFRRGNDSIFLSPGIRPLELIRPWLKWIFREPAVFATAISLPNLAEAEMVVSALDNDPMNLAEILFLKNLKIPVDWPA
jgi:predicted aldo/keto reductase-like oxidoreductase